MPMKPMAIQPGCAPASATTRRIEPTGLACPRRPSMVSAISNGTPMKAMHSR